MTAKSTYDPKIPETIGRFTFDNRDGLGAVGDGLNVNYKGFVIYMLPKDFLSLAFPLKESERREESVNLISESSVFGCPFLVVRFVESVGVWVVTSHEGRHRCLAIHKEQPNTPIPVHIFPSGEFDRAAQISPEMIFMPFVPEENRSIIGIIPDVAKMQKKIDEYREEFAQVEDESWKELIQDNISEMEEELSHEMEKMKGVESVLNKESIQISGNRYLRGQLVSPIQESKTRIRIRNILRELWH